MTRSPLRTFVLLTFGMAWGIPGAALLVGQTGAFEPTLSEFSPLSYVSLWAPAAAALIVVGRAYGRDGMWRFLRRMGRPTGPWTWYGAVLLGVPLLNLTAALGMEALGADAITSVGGGLGALIVLALLRLTEGPMEEFGWRGFALPFLQRRYGALGASVVLGSLWALWHLPAFLVGRSVGGGIAGPVPYVVLGFFLTLVAQSVLLTILVNATRGSVLVAVLFHWLTNLPYPWETGLDLSLVATPLWLGAALVVATMGRTYLRPEHTHTSVAPGLFPDEPPSGRDQSVARPSSLHA